MLVMAMTGRLQCVLRRVRTACVAHKHAADCRFACYFVRMVPWAAGRVNLRHLTRGTARRSQLEAAYGLISTFPQPISARPRLESPSRVMRASGVQHHGRITGALHAPSAASVLNPVCVQGDIILPAAPEDAEGLAASLPVQLMFHYWEQMAGKASVWKACLLHPSLWSPLPKQHAWPLFEERMRLLFQQCQAYLQDGEPVLCDRMIEMAKTSGATLIGREWYVVEGMSQFGQGDTVFALPDGSNVVIQVKHIRTAESGHTAKQSRTHHRHEVRQQAIFYAYQWFNKQGRRVTVYAASNMNDIGMELEQVLSS